MIEVRALSKRYGAVVAADRVSFKVGAGEVVGLLGPKGAGKTTILRMLAGILTPTEGDAFIGGVDVRADPFAAKQRLGFLSGDTALYQRLTPREVLRYFGRLHGLDGRAIEARSAQLIGELRMTDFADRRCATLSAGQKQRTNIARAFLHDPPALILDEPTSALDIVTGRFLLEAIKRARAAGKAVLFSTHVMGEAEYLCDRVLLLYRGRIIDDGTIDEVCARAQVRTLTEAFFSHLDGEEHL
ncbi:MAG TPA: ATP-binding cassette domain-containing protein [Polyangia bacterium]|nr:ATP-binding cassette domain-containing protein [Polyangia bacterium]